ncbi:MAG: ribosomal-protein-alanine N-acetyltransferase [Pseudomonadota bacterium]|jgi:[ribosomal protein S18]-alanine N-acetyltransferase
MSSASMTGTAAALRFAMMRAQDVEAVVAVENDAYPFPWTRGNFLDSLASRYEAWTLREADARLAGYFLLMHAVDETHLLNITVRPDLHGRGYGRMLLDKVIQLALDANMHSVLLEVRPSNEHALAVYRHCGFQPIGVRKQYYPAAGTSREDAIVMRLMLDSHGD